MSQRNLLGWFPFSRGGMFSKASVLQTRGMSCWLHVSLSGPVYLQQVPICLPQAHNHSPCMNVWLGTLLGEEGICEQA